MQAAVGHTRRLTHTQRWDGDARGTGVGNASAAVPALRELLELAHRPHWVAEQPEAHLEDHVRRAAETLAPDVTATGTTADGSYRVTLLHDPAMARRSLRVAAWGVIGAVAEKTTHVRESSTAGSAEFHVVTGMPDGADGFAAHGHHLVLTLVPKG